MALSIVFLVWGSVWDRGTYPAFNYAGVPNADWQRGVYDGGWASLDSIWSIAVVIWHLCIWTVVTYYVLHNAVAGILSTFVMWQSINAIKHSPEHETEELWTLNVNSNDGKHGQAGIRNMIMTTWALIFITSVLVANIYYWLPSPLPIALIIALGMMYLVTPIFGIYPALMLYMQNSKYVRQQKELLSADLRTTAAPEHVNDNATNETLRRIENKIELDRLDHLSLGVISSRSFITISVSYALTMSQVMQAF